MNQIYRLCNYKNNNMSPQRVSICHRPYKITLKVNTLNYIDRFPILYNFIIYYQDL